MEKTLLLVLSKIKKGKIRHRRKNFIIGLLRDAEFIDLIIEKEIIE